MGVLDFNKVKASVGKGREGKSTKHFATEKQREQLNGKYKIVRSVILNPIKVLTRIRHCSYHVAFLWGNLLVLSLVFLWLSKELGYMDCQGLET
ncbi:hypothetical protein Ahy_B03g067065 [Arachis hypogaea]|uniref:Uncharacterized protein n=1 Tax=Arachis hypogaea TaxID=3818 RepID=A0A445A5Q3_ARAHY|nr:hypothetical protein Ahy_B03g067065 [Arachis hypogaea]